MDVSALDILAYNNTAIDISAVEIVVGGHFGHYPNFCNLFVRLTRFAAPLWKHCRFWPRCYKKIMLNSAEHEIFPVHNNL